MLGVLVTLLFAVGAIGIGSYLVERWTTKSDPAEALGVQGLVGLGALGMLTLFIGLMPEGLHWGVIVIGALAAFGYTKVVPGVKQGKYKFAKPEGMSLLFSLALAVAVLFALVSVLAPSDTMDWDTLAYHLAFPKLWLETGQIHYISNIHHSNFPSTVEDLFVWGLTWGGQSGAKAFTLCFFVLGLIAIFGVARSRYTANAGWWSALAFATIPVVLWESGTGYIDVPHGLFGGLGVLYAARFLADTKDRSYLWLSGIMLGFAAGTKYTGLQTIGVVALVVAVSFVWRRQAAEGVKSAVLIGLAAMAVGGAWYVKNAIVVGNPVYPFFYSKLGGLNWDQRRADTYSEEQQKFGAGTDATRHNLSEIGNAMLGLAYQPGRYVNPGEDRGLGTPLGAVGIVVIAAGLLWALSGLLGIFEGSVLAVVGISMLMWFFLSQQSRYVVPLSVPLVVLAGGAIVRLKAGKFLAAATVAQAAFTLVLIYTQRFEGQSQVVLGKISPEEYQAHSIGFYTPSLLINKEAAGGKVALYDEVFGYLLDVPYMWANPPHSTVIPYDSMTDAASYVAAMKKLGFTHIYISLSPLIKDPDFAARWVAAMGLQAQPVPFSAGERKDLMDNWKNKWEVLLSDAVAQRLIVPVKGTNRWVLFKIQ